MRNGIVLLAVLTCAGAVAGEAEATGFASYFARVRATGAVQKSSGVSDSARTAVGVYNVSFNRKVDYCGWVASVADTTSGYATVTLKNSLVLTIRTFASNGAKANLPFNVMVQCAP